MLAAKEYEVGPKGSLVDMLSDGWLVASEEALPYPLTGLGLAWAWPRPGHQWVAGARLSLRNTGTIAANHSCYTMENTTLNVFSLSADMFVRISMSTKEM